MLAVDYVGSIILDTSHILFLILTTFQVGTAILSLLTWEEFHRGGVIAPTPLEVCGKACDSWAWVSPKPPPLAKVFSSWYPFQALKHFRAHCWGVLGSNHFDFLIRFLLLASFSEDLYFNRKSDEIMILIFKNLLWANWKLLEVSQEKLEISWGNQEFVVEGS